MRLHSLTLTGLFEEAMTGMPPAGDDAFDSSNRNVPVREEQFQFLFEHSPIATWEEDLSAVGAWLDGLRSRGVADLRTHLAQHPQDVRDALSLVRVLRVNRAAIVQNAARDKDHLIAGLTQLFTEDTYRAFAEELIAIWQGQCQIEHEFHSRQLNGMPLDIIVRIHIPQIDGRPDLTRVIVTGTDISRHKKAERTLRESQTRFSSLLENVPVCLLRKDAEGRYTYANEQYCAFLGHPLDEVLGKSDFDFFPRELAETYRGDDRRAMESDSVLNQEEPNARPSDEPRHVQVIKVPLCDDRDRPAGVQVMFWDITERKRSEDLLRESQETLAAIAATLKESEAFLRMSQRVGRIGSWEWNVRTNAVRWSDGMFLLYGLAPDQFDGTLDSSVQPIHPEDLPALNANIAHIVRGGDSRPMEFRIVRPDGSVGHMWGNGEITRAEDGTPLVMTGTVVDITERKQFEAERRKLELQIQHAQKLESLGVLTGGIAHDFNNLLTGILGYASLARAQVPMDSPVVSMLLEIERGGRRAADLTQQMLAYAGKGRFVVQSLRLDALVREISNLLHTVVSKKATVEKRLEPAGMSGDPSQIRQVVMNLITNASDALENHVGSIRIRTGVRPVSSRELRSPLFTEDLPGGDYAFVEVEDTGRGMNEETVQKIFDPFFTTKFTGRGLGLAAVLGIVRSHRGVIRVDTTPGRGTRFEVLFPAIAAGAEDSTPNPDAMPTGRGTVLIVDDERSVRNLARRVLEGAGFEVRLAINGQEAVEELFRPGREFVAVLLDLMMPEMDGAETLRQLRQRGAKVPVLIMSGYSERDVASQLEGLDAAGAIQKPFQPRDLVARICAMLPINP